MRVTKVLELVALASHEALDKSTQDLLCQMVVGAIDARFEMGESGAQSVSVMFIGMQRRVRRAVFKALDQVGDDMHTIAANLLTIHTQSQQAEHTVQLAVRAFWERMVLKYMHGTVLLFAFGGAFILSQCAQTYTHDCGKIVHSTTISTTLSTVRAIAGPPIVHPNAFRKHDSSCSGHIGSSPPVVK